MAELYNAGVALLIALTAYNAFNFWFGLSAATWVAYLVGRFIYRIWIGETVGAVRGSLHDSRTAAKVSRRLK